MSQGRDVQAGELAESMEKTSLESSYPRSQSTTSPLTSPALSPAASSLTGGKAADLQARILALQASRPRRESGSQGSVKLGGPIAPGGVPPRGLAFAPMGTSSAPGLDRQKSLSERRGMSLRHRPSINGSPKTDTPSSAAKERLNAIDPRAPPTLPKLPDVFSKYKNYLDIKTGSLNFKGKAALHSNGIDFTNGTSFRIALEDMEPLGELGAGNYGTVTKVLHKPTNVVMAMKEIRLELDETTFRQIIMELDVLHRSNLVNIVEFYGAFFVESSVYVCMEYMDGGSINKIYQGGVPEDCLAYIVHSTILALKHLKDSYKIIHRDVKPTNILCNSKGDVKLCDFGVSGNLVASIAKTNVGCQAYMAPERIRTGGSSATMTYTVESDIWSLGLSIIEMATGTYPYPPEAYTDIFSQLTAIVDGNAPELDPAKFSPDACSFVAKCLEKNPSLRPSYAELLDHPWLKGRDFSAVDMAGYIKSRIENKDETS